MAFRWRVDSNPTLLARWVQVFCKHSPNTYNIYSVFQCQLVVRMTMWRFTAAMRCWSIWVWYGLAQKQDPLNRRSAPPSRQLAQQMEPNKRPLILFQIWVSECRCTKLRLGAQWLSARLETEGPRVQASSASPRCGPWARHIYPSLVLVQPRKTRPCLTESLLKGRKELNQTNKATYVLFTLGIFYPSFWGRISASFLFEIKWIYPVVKKKILTNTGPIIQIFFTLPQQWDNMQDKRAGQRRHGVAGLSPNGCTVLCPWARHLFSTGSTQEMSWDDWKIVDVDLNHQHRQNICFSVKVITGGKMSHVQNPNALIIGWTLYVQLSSQHTVSGHHRPASETPFEWRFARRPMAARI